MTIYPTDTADISNKQAFKLFKKYIKDCKTDSNKVTETELRALTAFLQRWATIAADDLWDIS